MARKEERVRKASVHSRALYHDTVEPLRQPENIYNARMDGFFRGVAIHETPQPIRFAYVTAWAMRRKNTPAEPPVPFRPQMRATSGRYSREAF